MLALMIQDIVREYTPWIHNDAFGVATAALLVAGCVVLIFFMWRYFTGSLKKDIDKIGTKVDQNDDAIDDLKERMNKSTAEIIKEINSLKVELINSQAGTNDKMSGALVALNILAKRELGDQGE